MFILYKQLDIETHKVNGSIITEIGIRIKSIVCLLLYSTFEAVCLTLYTGQCDRRKYASYPVNRKIICR